MRKAILLYALLLPSLALGEIQMATTDIGPFVMSGPDVAVAVVRKLDGMAEFYGTVWHPEPFATVPVGKNVTEAASKSWKDTPLLVVASSSEMVLYIVDAKRGAVLAKPTIGGPVSSLAVDPRAESPYVYYALSPPDTSRETKLIGRINVETGKDEGLLDSDFSTNGPLELVVTDAGGLIYANGTRSGRGVIGLRVEEPVEKGQKARLTTVFTHRQQAMKLLPNPNGIGAAIQNDYYDRSLTRVVFRMHTQPACFLHKQNVYLSMENARLVARSANNTRVLGQVEPQLYMPVIEPKAAPLPGPKADAAEGGTSDAFGAAVVPVQFRNGPRRGGEREPLQMSGNNPVIVDEERRLVLLRHATGVLAIPLDHFGVLDEPAIGSRLIGGIEATAGEELSVDLQLADATTQVEIKEGPNGLVVKDRKLVWKPSAAQVGAHTVSLRLAVKDVAIQYVFDLCIQQRSVVLPIYPNRLVFTPDGSKVICFEPSSSQSPAPPDMGNGRLVTVDVKTAKVLATYVPAATISRFAVHDKYVFVAFGHAGAVKVLSVDDLKEQSRLFAPDRLHNMWVAGNYLALQIPGTPNADDTTWYSIETLKPIELPPYKHFPRWHSRGRTTAKTLEFRDVVYDLETLKPLGMTSPQHMVYAGQWMGDSSDRAHVDYSHGWGLQSGNLIRWDWTPVDTGNTYSNAIASDRPAWLTASFDEDPSRPSIKRRTRLVIGLRDMTATNERAKLILREQISEFGGHPQNTMIPITAGPGVFAAAWGQRLFIVPLDAFGVDKLSEPIDATVPTSRFHIEANEQAKLDLKASGGVAPYRWELVDPMTGITVVDANTLQIDAKAFAEHPDKWIMVGIRNFTLGSRELRGPTEQLDAYTETYRGLLKRAFELNVKHIPIAVPLRLRVTDAANNTVVIHWTLIVEVTREAFSNELSKAQKAFDATYAEHTVDKNGARSLESANYELGVLKRRIKDLEEENAKLRGKVEALSEIIQKQPKK